MIPKQKNLKGHWRLNGAKDLSTELSPDVSFDDSAEWTYDSDYWEIENSQAVLTLESDWKLLQSNDNIFETGVLYKIEVDIVAIESSIKITNGTSDFSDPIVISETGTHTFIVTSSNSSFLGISRYSVGSPTSVIINSISIKRIGLVKDFSGNGNHGIIDGTESYTTNMLGNQSFNFESNASINTGLNVDLNKSHTIAMKLSFVNNTNMTLLGKTSGTSSNDTELTFDINASNIRVFGYNENSVAQIVNMYATKYIGSEIILVAVINADKLITYINGERIDSIDINTRWKTSTSPLIIGSRGEDFVATANNPIGDVMVWNTTLTQSDIDQLQKTLTNPPQHVDPTILAVESDGVDQIIDLGLYPDSGTVCEVLGHWNTTASTNTMFGVQNNSTVDKFFLRNVNANTVIVGVGTSTDLITVDILKPLKIRLEGSGKCYIDDELVSTLSDECAGLMNRTLKLLAASTDTNGNLYNGNCTVYNCKVWQDGVLIRDMVPALNGTFYDKVNGEYYSNIGDGTLITKRVPYKSDEVSIPKYNTYQNDGSVRSQSDLILDGNTDEIEFYAKWNTLDNASASQVRGIGQHDPTNSGRFYFGNDANGNWKCGFGVTYPIVKSADTNWHHWRIGKSSGVKQDGVPIITLPYSFGYSVNKFNIGGHINGITNTESGSDISLAWFKIIRNGEVIRHYRATSDGTFIEIQNGIDPVVNDVLYFKDVGTENKLLFSTKDGATDLTGKNTITNNDAVIGSNKFVCGTTTNISVSDISFEDYEPWTISFDLKKDDPSGAWILGNDTIAGEALLYYTGYLGFRQNDQTYKLGSTILSDIITNRNLIVYVYDGYETISIYLNGVLLETIDNIDQSQITINNIGNGYITSAQACEGTFYNVEIYSEAKSTEWVKERYENEVKYW